MTLAAHTRRTSADNPENHSVNWKGISNLNRIAPLLPWHHNNQHLGSRQANEVPRLFEQSIKYPCEKNDPVTLPLPGSRRQVSVDSTPSLNDNHNLLAAIDGSVETQWVSRWSPRDHWYHINFHQKRLFDRIVIHFGKIQNQPTVHQYHIQFYYNGQWFNFHSGNLKQANHLLSDEVYLGGVDAAQLRIFIPSSGTNQGLAAIREIEIYLGQSKLALTDARLTGFVMPVEGGILPEQAHAYPNAPRNYRGGIHAGLDIHHKRKQPGTMGVSKMSANVDKSTRILAAQDGVILRSDLNYIPFRGQEFQNSSKHWQNHKRTFVMRSFGGRQVWIDHGNGVVTCYNHLDKIFDQVKPGTRIRRGEAIGLAGNSGLQGESLENNSGVHLHFEVWVDGEFLGNGLPLPQVKWLFHRLFAAQPGTTF